MTIGEDMIDAMWDSFPGIRAQLRRPGITPAQTVAKAICKGLEVASDPADQGLIVQSEANVRFRQSDEPSAWATGISGQVLEIQVAGGSWRRVRVERRVEVEEVVRYELQSEYGAQ
jgi:hypothetical protein